ncbi:HAD-IA family hydrolase [Saccharopolyspora sp. NFXS83]|uniref:HAD family hydrolase n=1 Tax=Saccharopolyspora sp. NFXS83 TaxID=2993560 RepID=UPI00224B29B7|nr:HAD-IA family hydrolase [Saccharopolyspora sp. NFXS83]MCX2730361.1 HAD-IA family hydrolase [Saccharopolyspora sp. NFXS83]
MPDPLDDLEMSAPPDAAPAESDHRAGSSTGVEELISSAAGLLLDFDGPICELFAGYSPRTTAAAILAVLNREKVDFPADLHDARGGLALLEWAQFNTPELVPDIEDIQEAAELRALRTARPTPHSLATAVAATEAGLKVAVVSNNSAEVVAEYLTRRGFAEHVHDVVGREPGRAVLMKPNPDPLRRAASALNVPIRRCVMVGDAISDIVAANRAGASSIGYARNDDPLRFTRAGADVVIRTMSTLSSAISTSVTRSNRRDHKPF